MHRYTFRLILGLIFLLCLSTIPAIGAPQESPEAEAATLEAAARVRLSAQFELVREPIGIANSRHGEAYAAALPLFRDKDVIGSMVVVGSARNPFAALDDRFLVALGRQVGAALENAALNQDLRNRSEELGRLAAAMVRQHEEEVS